jgi:glutamate-1-semialdehyde 2,1-aminomutase
MAPASAEYLGTLRRIADDFDIVLISDEVISFRVGYHGAQGEFGFRADLTAMGKIIGGGFPVGAVGGRSDIMSVFDPTSGRPRLPHGGTFNANPMTMVAGLKAMELMTREAFDRINRLGNDAREQINSIFRQAKFQASATGMGSLLRIHLSPHPVKDYRSAYQTVEERAALSRLHKFLLNHGVFIGPAGLIAISTPMTAANLTELVDAVRDGVQEAG